MIRAALIAVLSASAVAADDWQRLTGDQIGPALTARVLVYEGGQTLIFHADGRTLYHGDSAQSGQWRVEGDHYCSVWPPSDRWDCYALEREAKGLDLRFVSGGGAVTTGRYSDAN